VEIRISKSSEVPIREQLAEQIVLLIATGRLKPSESLPSVRELARRLKIHHNTVSQAYRELVARSWLVRRRGAHLVVRAPQVLARPGNAQDLDDLINTTIEAARERGYSLQALRARVRERLLAEPPDHVLVVEEEAGLRRLLEDEIREATRLATAGCSREVLALNPGLAIGALAVTPEYALADVEPLLPKSRPPVPVRFSNADEHVERIQKLREPSVVAVVSVSQAFLTAARGLLAPALGRRHTLVECLFPLENPRVLRVADLVFCDSIAVREAKAPTCLHYRLIPQPSLDDLKGAIKSLIQA
jgi:GntR family transcriptional regulator